MALERIFRLGFSLTLQLKTLAETLVKKGGVNPIALESPWDDVMRALRGRRPEYPRAIDSPPADGTRHFAALAAVARAAAALETIAQIMHTAPRE